MNLDRGLAPKHTLPASLRSRAVFGCAWDIPVYPSGSLASYNLEFWNILPRLESPILAVIETIAATSPGTTCGNRGAGQTSEHFPGSIVAQKVTANPNSHDVCRNSCGKRIVSSFRGGFPEIVPRIMFRGTAVSSITSNIRLRSKPQWPQICDSGFGNKR